LIKIAIGGRMIHVGDIVKMKDGYSAPGTVIDVMERHPRADEPKFLLIREALGQPHAKVLWSDHEISEVIPVTQIVRL
jgi:hypothetical protein